MNHYFRLLIVGSILFILLGLFNEQSEDSIAQYRIPYEIENVEFLSGLLPASPGFQPTPLIFSNSIKNHSVIHSSPEHYKLHISLWIDHSLCFLESEYIDRKQLLSCRTGQFLHSNTGREYPSLL